MITVNEQLFKIDTANTSYVFCVNNGHLEQLYYGKKIRTLDSYNALQEKIGTGLGTTVFYSDKSGALSLDNLCQEYSTIGKGDFHEPFIELRKTDGSFVNDFIYDSYTMLDNYSPKGLPSSYGKQDTLRIKLIDHDLVLYLYYSTFADSDVIVKSCELINNSNQTISIEKLMSSQLDLPYADYDAITLDGAWARERYQNIRPLSVGIYSIDSKVGYSSNTHNPYFVIKKHTATYDHGDCYGINLIYTGNHIESAEVTIHNKTRLLNGINPHGFCWQLQPNESFATPEATLCYADGLNNLTQQYHDFINSYIVRGYWKNRERPVLVNNWEATNFNFTQEKLLRIAMIGKSIGAELFVLDDGWFGNRTNDTKGLGDWYVNQERFPDGLGSFADKLNQLGLDFGLWVEPEMVNPDSELYRAHPNWAVTHPDYTPSLARHQLLLDLTNPQVRQYIIERMTEIFSSCNLSYVKWDFNRPMSDFYSPTLACQGEFFHRYMLGLYEILGVLTDRFPRILFESCASGGGRVDMGLLCYMPQYWCSDNTDSYDRVRIQAGTLSCYPISTMGAHVSGVPNMQTLRTTSIDNRYNTACFGLLGYELDLTKLTENEQKIAKEQIDYYKYYRKTIQYGKYYVIKDIFTDTIGEYAIVNKDKSQAIVGYYNNVAPTSPPSDILCLKGFDDNKLYNVQTRPQFIPATNFGDLIYVAMPDMANNPQFAQMLKNDFMLPCEVENYIVMGDLLNNAGIKLSQQYSSSGYNSEIRIMQDFGSRIYGIDEIKQA